VTNASMSNSEKYRFSDFTYENYENVLTLASRNYSFRTYDNFVPGERYVLWRHDLDFSVLDAVPLAHIEAGKGIVATYFVYLHDGLYNLLESRNFRALREILDLGHRIGLHFDSAFYDIDDEAALSARLRQEAALLECQFSVPIKVFSFHNPTPKALSFDAHEYAGMVNAYSRYFRHEVEYCSDSNGYWRHKRLADLLEGPAGKPLQVLTHPLWWTQNVMSPLQKVDAVIGRLGGRFRREYLQTLSDAGRTVVDW